MLGISLAARLDVFKTLIATGFVIAQVTACTVGGELSEGEALGYAVNRPRNNGCDPNVSVSECVFAKQIEMRYACMYEQRVPNAFFRVAAYSEGKEEDGGWRFEAPVFWLPDAHMLLAGTPGAGDRRQRHSISEQELADIAALPLRNACEDYGFSRGSAVADWATWLPDLAACNEIGGVWQTPYCVAGPSSRPQRGAR